ncbi:MAG TPA: G/U mismatch-specific DNA glycosylase [Chloroflexi bacterium]|nr:G/U mismatch-specific DNA glycosylase [Chloroflexota bacterium]
MNRQPKPSQADLRAAADRGIADVIAPRLRVLFVGINPGLYSGWSGHHFARPGNRFWPTLYAAGFTPRQLHPSEQHRLLDYGCGVTNFVNRATATAAEVSADELIAGAARLEYIVRHFQPQAVAVLGITAYRTAFRRPKAQLGRQPDALAEAPVWVLPNPSGLNAHYTPAALAALFADFRRQLETLCASSRECCSQQAPYDSHS